MGVQWNEKMGMCQGADRGLRWVNLQIAECIREMGKERSAEVRILRIRLGTLGIQRMIDLYGRRSPKVLWRWQTSLGTKW